MRHGDSIPDSCAHQTLTVKNSPRKIIVRNNSFHLRKPVDKGVQDILFRQTSMQDENPVTEERTNRYLFRIAYHKAFSSPFFLGNVP